MPRFDTPEPITASVEISAGDVRVVASQREDTIVEVRPRDDTRSHDVKAAEQVRVDFHNGTLAVASRRGFSLPRRGAVVVDIALPAGSRLSAAVASANVDLEGEFGDCTFASASGDLTVGSVTGNVRADTASGDITVTSLRGAAEIAAASGNAWLAGLDGEVKFRAASGSLRVGVLHGVVNTQTASGDVTVTAAVRGNICAQTSSGEVAIGIAEGTAAQLDVRTSSGSVRNSLSSSDGPAPGEQTLVVSATTRSADVIIQRASGQCASEGAVPSRD